VKYYRYLILSIFLLSGGIVQGQDFQSVNFGDDFLSIGGGARALGMGSAHASFTDDVTAAFWNVGGLAAVDNIEVTYMHSERFSGVVNFDYGAVAIPVNNKNANSVVAFTVFRQGVDGIKNTLDAFDADLGQPKPDPTRFFTEFSARDFAFFLSYATEVTDKLSWGVSAKLLNSKIGPFANAWGYSLDLGMMMRGDFLNIGLNLQNITGLRKFWDTNPENLQQLATTFDDEIPEGQNEKTPPTVKFGLSKDFNIDEFNVLIAADSDFRFEGREAFYISTGNISIEPHIGSEITYKDLVSLRSGITNFAKDFDSNLTVSPTFGAGLYFKSLSIDYGFSNFSGVSSELGNTHRISILFGF